MKRLVAVFVLLALPAAAQDHRPSVGAGGGNASGAAPRPSGGSGGGSGGSAAPSGGGTATASGGGSTSSGGTSSGGGGSAGAGRVNTGGSHSASGGSGVAVTRNPDRGASTSTGRHGDGGAISNGAATTSSGSGATAAPRAAGTAADSARTARTGDGNYNGVPAYARPRTDQPVTGTAVPRGSVPGPAPGPGAGSAGIAYTRGGGSAALACTGSYWGYPGYYYNSYFGNFYGPGGYSGYSDPWFGGYPDAQDPMPSGGASSGGWVDEGTLRLKIKPRDAEVYVDGFYVGVVDDFDGMFQKLHIEAGPHRIEIRAAGYEPLVFEVRITIDHLTTYQGELKRIQ